MGYFLLALQSVSSSHSRFTQAAGLQWYKLPTASLAFSENKQR